MMMMTTLMEKTIQSHSSSTAKPSSTSSAKSNLFLPVPNTAAALAHSPSSHTSSPSPAPSSLASTPTPSLAPITPPSATCPPMTTDHDLDHDLDHDRITQPLGTTFDDARTTTDQAMAPLLSAQTQPRSFVANSSSNVHTEKLSDAIGSHPTVKQESNITATETQTQTQLSLPARPSLCPHTQQQPQRPVPQIKAQPQLIARPHSPCSSSKAQSATNSSSPIQGSSAAVVAPGGSVSVGVSVPHQQVSQQQHQHQHQQQQQQQQLSSSSVLKTGTFTFTTPGEGGLHGPIQDMHIPPTSQQSGTSGSSSSSSLVTAARPTEDVMMTGSCMLTATNNTNNNARTLPPTPTPTPNATPGSTPRKSRSKGGRRAANPHLTEEQRRRERVLKNRESAMKSLQKKKRYTQNLEHHAIALAKRNAELRDKIGVLLVRLNHLHGLPAQQLGLESLNLGTSSGTGGGISNPVVPHIGGAATPSSAPMSDHTLAFANNSNNTNRVGNNAHAGDIGVYNKDPTNRMRGAQPLEGDGSVGWRSLSFEQGVSSAAQYINNPNLQPHPQSHATLSLPHQQQQQQANAASSLLLDNNNNNNNTNNMKALHQPPQQSALISANTSSQSLPNVVAPSDSCPTVLDSPI